MRKIVRVLFVLSLLFISLATTLGINPLKPLSGFPGQEKVHLHLDKPYYAAGDNIWFKAYVLEEQSLSPTTLSSVLYVDLIREDKAVHSLKLPLENGVTFGDFKLSDSIPEGNYRIRAYTQWMRNASEAFFFDKRITIGNGIKNSVFVNSNFVHGLNGDTSWVSAAITFISTEGKPYANKKITSELHYLGKSRELSDQYTDSIGQVRFVFQRPKGVNNELKVVSTIALNEKNIVSKTVSVPPAPVFDVQFFPEGGQLVKGIPSKVAVRATNSNNGAEIIEGILIGSESIKFTTNKQGLGYFILNPSSTATQKVSITFKNGSKRMYDLPKVVQNGYSMMLKSNGVLQVYLSESLLNSGNLSVVGQRNGMVYFKKDIPTTKQAVSMTIPFASLPSGILQLSLLSAEGIPLSERVTFINHEFDKVNLAVGGLKSSYTKRSMVELTLSAKQLDLPVSGSFSVSVTNMGVVSPDIENESNIFTSFLLNSDSRSRIENANYYLSEEALLDVDLLMLTGSWRNAPWKQREEKPKYPQERTLSISGKLTNNGKPVSNGKVTLMKSTGGFDMLSTISDVDGRFRFDSLSFSDSTRLLVQARTAGDKKNVKILIDQIPGQEITVRDKPNSNIDINGRLMNYIRQSEDYFQDQLKRLPLAGVNQLKEVEITGGRNLRENYVRMHSKADQEFTAKDLDSAAFLSQVLFGHIRGNYRKYRVMLDGFYLDGPDLYYFFSATDPSTLESIEVLSSPHLIRNYGNRPLLIVTSKRFPTFNQVKYAPGLTTLTPKGFSFSRTFQSPDYEKANDQRPDLRPTVYWNPNIAVDEKGNLKIKYFNTDLTGKYRIVIEGIGGNRGLGRKEIYYEVK